MGCSGCEAAAESDWALTDVSEDPICDGLDKYTSLFVHFSLKCKRKPHFEDSSDSYDCSMVFYNLKSTPPWYTRTSLFLQPFFRLPMVKLHPSCEWGIEESAVIADIFLKMQITLLREFTFCKSVSSRRQTTSVDLSKKEQVLKPQMKALFFVHRPDLCLSTHSTR